MLQSGSSCTHVAMAMTAKPINEASSTKHPNCSRMGMRILTIAGCREARVEVFAAARRGCGSRGRVRVSVS